MKIKVVFYAEGGAAPALEWLAGQPPKVQDKFDFLIAQLEENGPALQRPHAAPLGQKIYELRVRFHRVNYRLLYFFDGKVAAVLAHGCTKEAKVDVADIKRAAMRREIYLSDRRAHTFIQVG